MNCAGIPSWSDFVTEKMSEGHACDCVGASKGPSGGCVSPNPGDFTARHCRNGNTCGVASSVFCWVWKGNEVFPNSKNTL